MDKKHFSGLDGLRFISITFVVLHHFFTFKSYFGYNQIDFQIIGVIGHYGIHFFFTGSGFLITYLLLVEQQRFGKINLGNFFVRRILRIWPAYILLILIMLTVHKHPFFYIPNLTDAYINGAPDKSNSLYLLLMPHLAPFVNSTAPYVHPTYTIGIEEQFYFSWGILFTLYHRHFKRLLMVLAFGGPILNVVHLELFEFIETHPDAALGLVIVKKLLYYFKYSKISVFAIGSLLGYAFYEQSRWIFMLRKKTVQVALYSILSISLISQVELPFFYYEYMALITGLVMMAATFRKESIFNYSAPWLERLGKVSYGIYLFHIFAIVFGIKLMSQVFGLRMDDYFNLLLTSLITLTLATFFGYLSYHTFEKWFLLLKDRFKKV